MTTSKAKAASPFLNIDYKCKGRGFLPNFDKKKILRIKNKAEFILRQKF